MLRFAKARGIERFRQSWDRLGSHFRDIPDNPAYRRQIELHDEPSVRYVIYFTPRSGSTWLTALIESAGGCGSPGEFFNPRLMRQTASLVGAQNLQDYIHLVTRRSGIDGVFGCEVTSGHLHAVFRDDREFLDLLRPTASLFLIREDIVAQAVSASRLEQTGVAHKIGDFTEGRVEPNFRYSHRQIHNYLGRLLFMEKQLEGFFQRQNTKPLRMSYERLTSQSPQDIILRVASHIGVSPKNLNNLESQHKKIGDALSEEYIARFRSENKRLLDRVAA